MSGLSFLQEHEASIIDIWQEVIESFMIGSLLPKVSSLAESQIEKLRVVLDFISTQPKEQYSSILTDLGCPKSGDVANLLASYHSLLKSKAPIHNLRDFDWSTSLVLGTNKVSNLKEPITSFSFEIENNGKIENKNLELTLEEAEQMLKQIEDARSAQRALMGN